MLNSVFRLFAIVCVFFYTATFFNNKQKKSKLTTQQNLYGQTKENTQVENKKTINKNKY